PTPAPTPPPAPAAKAPPPPPPTPPAAPPDKPVTKPGAPEPGPPKNGLQPLQPKEEHGLLVGRYRSYSSAGKKMEQLKKKGLPAFIRRDKGRYQVWVGPFATSQEARKAAKIIKGKKRRAPKIQKITIPVPK
ncbi:MAG: SPOR domain-containing protein, partial [Syntrophales bacterium]|nr:SPOR domain-containing protein [Syntrophales bacterium]